MPTRFLSDAEVERLEGFPEAIDERGLACHFHLDGADLAFVRRQYSAAGQLGVALQLCALRWLGFVPEDLTAAPPEATTALAAVLDVPPRSIFDYSVRPQTRREHRPLVREHAGFAAAGARTLEPATARRRLATGAGRVHADSRAARRRRQAPARTGRRAG